MKKSFFLIAISLLCATVFAQSPCSPGGIHRLCFHNGQSNSPLITGNHHASDFLGTTYVGCIRSAPRATWAYLQIDQPGNVLLFLEAYRDNGLDADVDFACWGPLPTDSVEVFLQNLCNGTYTFFTGRSDLQQPSCEVVSHRPENGDHSTDLGGWPFPNVSNSSAYNWVTSDVNHIPMIDCSYSAPSSEWCYIPNAQSGEIYLIMTTNYSNFSGNFYYTQENVPYATGTINCPTITVSDTITLCENDLPLVYGDTTFDVGTTSGNWTYNYESVDGYDSIVTLTLIVNPILTSEFTISNSDGYYIWGDSTYTRNGDYVQIFTSTTGCDSIVTLHLTIDVGIEDHNNNETVLIYPNPTSTYLYVEGRLSPILNVAIYDLQGRLVGSHKCNEQRVKLSTSDLSAGEYILKITTAEGTITRKIGKMLGGR